MLSASYIKELDISFYVIHVCRGSLTFPLIHCILYFMWVRVLSSLLYVMHVCKGANFTSLSSWIYIAYTLYCFDLWQEKYVLCVCTPLLMNWQKGGEKFGVFICMFVLFVTFYHWYQDWYQVYLLFVGIKSIFCCIFWLVSRTCLFHWYQI